MLRLWFFPWSWYPLSPKKKMVFGKISSQVAYWFFIFSFFFFSRPWDVTHNLGTDGIGHRKSFFSSSSHKALTNCRTKLLYRTECNSAVNCLVGKESRLSLEGNRQYAGALFCVLCAKMYGNHDDHGPQVCGHPLRPTSLLINYSNLENSRLIESCNYSLTPSGTGWRYSLAHSLLSMWSLGSMELHRKPSGDLQSNEADSLQKP